MIFREALCWNEVGYVGIQRVISSGIDVTDVSQRLKSVAEPKLVKRPGVVLD
jgi:hypothetical protein